MKATVVARTGLVVAAAVLAAPVVVAQDGPTRSIVELTDGLYRAQNNNHHVTFLVTDEGAILADTINTEFSEWLKAEIDSRFGVPVRYVLYSHHHWDHANGGGVFEDTAQFIAHENFPANLELPPEDTALPANAAELDANGDGLIDSSEATGNFANSLHLYDVDGDGMINGAEATRGALNEVRAPDIVFKDRMTVTLGGKSVDILYVGNMQHTDDMSVVLFPEERAVFMVDYISLGRVPFQTIAANRLDALLNSIRMVEFLDFDIASPGHGVVGDKSSVAAYRHYLEQLRDEVAAGIAAGMTVEQLQESVTMDAYSDWINYENWRPLNVLGMYNLLTNEPY